MKPLSLLTAACRTCPATVCVFARNPAHMLFICCANATRDAVPEDTPGYSLYIKEKIDISTIEARLNARQYDSLAAFEAAFKLMYDNCDVYNDPTINPSGGVYLECSRKGRAKAEKRFGKIRKKLLEGGKKADGGKARPQVQLKLSMK